MVLRISLSINYWILKLFECAIYNVTGIAINESSRWLVAETFVKQSQRFESPYNLGSHATGDQSWKLCLYLFSLLTHMYSCSWQIVSRILLGVFIAECYSLFVLESVSIRYSIRLGSSKAIEIEYGERTMFHFVEYDISFRKVQRFRRYFSYHAR